MRFSLCCFFVVVNLFGNEWLDNYDSLRMTFLWERLALFLKNRFCRMEMQWGKGGHFKVWKHEETSEFISDSRGPFGERKWPEEREKLRNYAERKREKEKKDFFFLSDVLYMITISWVFGYLLKQLINLCIAFQVSCFFLPFLTKTLCPYNLGSTSGKKMFMIVSLVFKAEILSLLLSHFWRQTFSLMALLRLSQTGFRAIIPLRKQ